jgi:hypothetical protein
MPPSRSSRGRVCGGEWTADRFRWLQQRYPVGVPKDQLDTIVAEHGPRAGHQKPLQLLCGRR